MKQLIEIFIIAIMMMPFGILEADDAPLLESEPVQLQMSNFIALSTRTMSKEMAMKALSNITGSESNRTRLMATLRYMNRFMSKYGHVKDNADLEIVADYYREKRERELDSRMNIERECLRDCARLVEARNNQTDGQNVSIQRKIMRRQMNENSFRKSMADHESPGKQIELKGPGIRSDKGGRR